MIRPRTAPTTISHALERLTRGCQVFGLLCFGALSSHAYAHQIWLESDAKGARLHFGEYEKNLKEVSPGLLDKLSTPTLSQLGAKPSAPVASEKFKDYLLFAFTAQPTEAWLVVENNWPLVDRSKRNLGVLKFIPAARWVPNLAPREPVAKLNIVPAATAGAFKVFYDGKPLAKTKVNIAGPSGAVRTGVTAEDGGVTFTTPWRGQYVLEINYTDKTPGKHNAQSYVEVSYSTTLTFVHIDGIVAPPLPPPAKPNS